MRIAGYLIAVVALALLIDHILIEAKERRVSHAISRCGGRMGSIPFWPMGTEYRVTFPRPLTSRELDELAELNSLRGSVGVAFIDCELSKDQIDEARRKLPNCALIRVIEGNASILGRADH
jgi:hypothetical protein